MELRPLTMQIALCLSVLLSGALTYANDDKAGVSLMLSNVSAERDPQDTLFHCEVTIDNHTGKEITVTSNFHSAFDGLELVVTNVHGKVLKQQPYTSHQSPFASDGREFVLKRGKTKKSIVFPVRSFGMVGQSLKVRLVGTLPGSSYKRILSTDTIKTVIGK
jgi:hypothetical protein